MDNAIDSYCELSFVVLPQLHKQYHLTDIFFMLIYHFFVTDVECAMVKGCCLV
jgi:hypothetical protein